jgi:galactofuranose transport system ATP-binding protein
VLGRELSEVARARTRFGTHDTAQEGGPMLRATGLTRRRVLDDVSVEVRAGEVVGLAGLLGSGRTETAKAIYGAQPLDTGTVDVAGEAVRPGSPRAAISAGIALIPEDRKADGIIPTLSVRENIVLAALPTISRAGFVSRRQQDALVESLMTRLRIKASSPDQRVSELSGGNQQKVLLARVLCLEPRVLLLDDPTRGIDIGAKAEIQALIGDLAEAGLAVVLISSELEEVVEGSDRIIVLRDGAVVGTLSGTDVTQDGVLGLIAAAADRAEAEQDAEDVPASELRAAEPHPHPDDPDAAASSAPAATGDDVVG